MLIDNIRKKVMLTNLLHDFVKDYNKVIYGLNPFPPSEIHVKDYIDLWIEKLLMNETKQRLK